MHVRQLMLPSLRVRPGVIALRSGDGMTSARLVADHLGHAKPSMTQDVYMGRKAGSTAAAAALGALEL